MTSTNRVTPSAASTDGKNTALPTSGRFAPLSFSCWYVWPRRGESKKSTDRSTPLSFVGWSSGGSDRGGSGGGGGGAGGRP